MVPFFIKKGDRSPGIEASFGASLTGWTVAFSMAPVQAGGGATLKVAAAAAVVVDAGSGAVRYDWGATDTTTAGAFVGEFVATETATGKKRSCPLGSYLDVRILDHVPVSA